MRSFRTRLDRRASARARAQSALTLLKYKSNSLEARVQCRWLRETCSLLFAWRRSHDQTVSCCFLHRWHNVAPVLESHRCHALFDEHIDRRRRSRCHRPTTAATYTAFFFFGSGLTWWYTLHFADLAVCLCVYLVRKCFNFMPETKTKRKPHIW